MIYVFRFVGILRSLNMNTPEQCLSCKKINFLLLDPVVALLVLPVVSFVLVMYESSFVISHKIGLRVLLLWYE